MTRNLLNKSRIKYLAVAILVIIAVGGIALYASSQPTPTPTIQPTPTLNGKITVSGAFALYPLVIEWSQQFQKLNPGVTIDVSAGGAGKGMTDTLSGLSDLGMISREITPTEIQNGAYYIAVTRNAVVATVNKDNPVLNDILTKGLTRQTLYNIYIAENVTTWGQVVGRSDVTAKINVYTRSDSSGAADSFVKYLGNKSQSALLGVGVNADPGLAQAVIADKLGIGFNNIAYAFDPDTKQQLQGLTIIPIDVNENGQVDTNENFYSTRNTFGEAIADGLYPKGAVPNLYLVTKNSFTSLTKAFLKWVLTDGQKYVESAGFVPLTPDAFNDQIRKLDGTT